MGADYTGGVAECGSACLRSGMRDQPTGVDGERKHCPVPKLARRVGAIAFAFFLIKGLVWLGLAGAVAVGLMR